MGKQTAAQQAQQRALEKAQNQVRVPKEGVTITMQKGDDIEFDGDFDAQLTPTGVVCIIEMVPDLLNQNSGNPIPVIRKFVNAELWAEITVR